MARRSAGKGRELGVMRDVVSFAFYPAGVAKPEYIVERLACGHVLYWSPSWQRPDGRRRCPRCAEPCTEHRGCAGGICCELRCGHGVGHALCEDGIHLVRSHVAWR